MRTITRTCRSGLSGGIFCLLWLLSTFSLVAGDTEKGLILHLPFDGTAEPIVGKELSKPRVFNNPNFVEGRHGQAISLTDGAHLLLTLPDKVTEGEFSIAFWIKPLWHVEDNVPHPIFEIPAAPKSYDKVGWSPTQLLFSKGWSKNIAPNGFYGVVSIDLAKRHLKPGQWTYVVLSYSCDSKYYASYFNGDGWRRRADKKRPFAFYKKEMWLGSRAGGKGNANVIIDDLKIFDYPVSPDEIPAIAGTEFPPPPDRSMTGNKCDPANAVETPHRKWAKPLAGGSLKVLCVVEGRRGREFIELAQRFDIDPVLVTSPVNEGPNLIKLYPDRFKKIGDRIRSYLKQGDIDCVIIASFGWNLLDQSTRDAILNYVRVGGGLLLAAPRCHECPGGVTKDLGHSTRVAWPGTPEGEKIEKLVHRLLRKDEDYLAEGIPWDKLSMFKIHTTRQSPGSLFRGGTLGKGRILIYDINTGGIYSGVSLTPVTRYVRTVDLFDYEYALAAAARAVLWTAHRDSEVRIGEISYNSRRFFRQLPAGLKNGGWVINLLNYGKNDVKAMIKLSVRTKGFDAPKTISKTLSIKPGEHTVFIPYTLDRKGVVFADVQLLIDAKVADWGTGTATVDKGNPYIYSATSDREMYMNGQQPRITAAVCYKKYALKVGVPGTLFWRLYDPYQRLVKKGEKTFTFDAVDAFTRDVTITLPAIDDHNLRYELVMEVAKDNGKITDQHAMAIRVKRKHSVDEFVFFAWGNSGTAPGGLATQVLRDHYHLTSSMVYGVGEPITDVFLQKLELLNKLNIQPWIYATQVGYGPDEEYKFQPDPADMLILEQMRSRLRGIAEIVKPYSPLFYSLGDEAKSGPKNANPSGNEQDVFRAYLKREYRTLNKLNEAWQTDYKFWKEIVIPTSEGMGKGNPRLVAVHKKFRERLFADRIGACASAVLDVDPGARVGVEGVFGLQHCYGTMDYRLVVQRSTFMGQYAMGWDMDMVRSFQKPGDLLGCWYNYNHNDRGYSLYGPWHSLLRGLKAFGWFTTFSGDAYSTLNPDFTPTEQFQWTYSELEPLLNGIGKLIHSIERDSPEVFVLYNYQNLHRSSPHYLAMKVTSMLLDDAGVQHDYIAGDQVIAEKLEKRGAKVLILAGQYTMDPKVAEKIRGFVKNGGILISDKLPASSDGLHRYEKRPLDDLFADRKQLKGGVPPCNEKELAEWSTHEKSHGKGKTLLFGSYPDNYLEERMKPNGDLFRRVFKDFLTKNGVRQVFSVKPEAGDFLPVTVVGYHDGNSRYTGMQRDYRTLDQSSRKFLVTGSGKAHIYDVRNGRYLGHNSKATVSLEPARGILLAFLPYKVLDIQVSGLKKSYRQGREINLKIQLRTDGGIPDGGVFRIEVINPTGKPVLPLCRLIKYRYGGTEVNLKLAYNDPAGNWTIRTTDISTGTGDEKNFTLEPAP